jgi:Carboxypeptidase regulatory-like domain
MSIILRTPSFVFAALIFAAATVWGAPPALEGSVADKSGKMVPGAEVRIEAGKLTKVVKTDGKGNYICTGLTAGVTYRATVLVNGAAKSSMNIKMESGKTQLNFNLDNVGVVSASRKGTHRVWVPPKAGSNLGGHWSEVEDDADSSGMTRASDRPH